MINEQKDARWIYHVRERHFPVNSVRALEHVKKQDAEFISKLRGRGINVDSLERELAEQQKEALCLIEWEAGKERRKLQAEIETRRIKDEADQRQADKFAKAVRAEAEKFIMELVAAGVLHVGK